MSESNPLSRRKFLINTTIAAAGAASASLIKPGVLKADSLYAVNSQREPRILTISQEGIATAGSNGAVNPTIERIEMMTSYNPDVIVLPEAFATTVKTAETLDGPIITKFAKLANKYNSYVVCPLHLKVKGKIYNASVLIDRKGKVVGHYNKIHPTSRECDNGCTPGNLQPPVFKTDFGTVGMQICFDSNWPDGWKRLKDQGAEIVFFSATYPSSRLINSYAIRFNYYVAGSSRRDPVSIYDISGDLIDKSEFYEHFAFAPLNLEKVLCEIDFIVKKIRAMRKKYGDKLHIKFYGPDDWVTIETRTPDIPIKQIIDEYNLFPQHSNYIKQQEKYQDKFRS